MANKNTQIPLPELPAARDFFRELTSKDFLNFGLHEVAYIRAVTIGGQRGFAVHAADGTPLSVMESFESAQIVIKHNDLETASVH